MINVLSHKASFTKLNTNCSCLYHAESNNTHRIFQIKTRLNLVKLVSICA